MNHDLLGAYDTPSPVPTAATRGGLSLSELTSHDASLQSYIIGKDIQRALGRDSPFSCLAAQEKVLNNPAWMPDNDMEEFWYQYKLTEDSALVNETHVRGQCVRVDTVTSNLRGRYWASLNLTSDPAEYIRLLAAHRGAGVNLRAAHVNSIPYFVSNDVPRDYPDVTFSGAALKQMMADDIAKHPPFPVDYGSTVKSFPEATPDNCAMFYVASADGKAVPLRSEAPADVWSFPDGKYHVGMGTHNPMYPERWKARTFDTPLPHSEQDRAYYEQMVRNFDAVILTRFLRDAFDVLDMSVQEDLPALSDAYDVLYNRVQFDVFRELNAAQKIRVMLLHRGESYAMPEILSMIPDNEIDGPLVSLYNAKGEVISRLPCRQTLVKLWSDALALLKSTIDRLGARVLQLRAPGSVTFSPEESRNPFLVYDSAASRAAGRPVLQNVAVNLTTAGVGTKTFVPEGGPTVAQYEALDRLEAEFVRNIETDYGGSLSIRDLQKIGALPPGGIFGAGPGRTIVPWLIGGAAAAAVLSQVMG